MFEDLLLTRLPPLAGRHKVRWRMDGRLRPKLFCEAKIDEIYNLINIGHIRKK